MSAAPLSFHALALNVNGLGDYDKIADVRSLINTERPHVFVLAETKSSRPIASRLKLDDYQFFESPGVPTEGRAKCAKWGVTAPLAAH